jgi:hypothetical protein
MTALRQKPLKRFCNISQRSRVDENLESKRILVLASAMPKTGHPLNQFATPWPAEVLRRLRDDFSITTAEELISAAANSAPHLRSALELDLHRWNDLVQRAYDAVEPSIRDFLAEPLASPFGKGAVLNETENLPPDYQKYLG